MSAADSRLDPKPCYDSLAGRLRIGTKRLDALAALSAPGLAALRSGISTAAAQRCVDARVGHASVALRLFPRAALQLRVLARRSAGGRRWPASCAPASRVGKVTRRRGWRRSAAVEGGGSRRVAWFAACVPVSCALGDDTALREVAWAVLWRRLVPPRLAAAQQRSAERRSVGWRAQASATVAKVMMLRLFGDARPPPTPEMLLAEEVLEGAGEDGPFDIVTVTDKPAQAHALRSSLPWPLRLRVLRPPGTGPWRFRWFDTERYLLAYTSYLRRRGLGDRLVIYLDAFDTTWLGCHRDLLRVFKGFGRGMFFGAEFDLYPACLPGYPCHAGSHAAAARKFGNDLGQPLELCNPVKPAHDMHFEPEPLDEYTACTAISATAGGVKASGIEAAKPAAAHYVNGGVYGGRAVALEAALRGLLAQQTCLAAKNVASGGLPMREAGKTHQYFWNQYFLDRQQEVALDYGGAIVVNLARRSLAPRQFGLDPATGLLHSHIFRRPVCVAHSNGGGYADRTFQLLRVAAALRLDTVQRAGMPITSVAMNSISEDGLYVDLGLRDRLTIDLSVCFRRPSSTTPSWQGTLTKVHAVTPHLSANPTYDGLQFFVVRPIGVAGTDGRHSAYRIVDLQRAGLNVKGFTRRSRNASGPCHGRNTFDIQTFNIRAQQGDCLAWRCLGRCDLTFADPVPAASTAADAATAEGVREEGQAQSSASPGLVARGVAFAPGRDLEVGAEVAFGEWRPRRAYALGVEAELQGVGFYEE